MLAPVQVQVQTVLVRRMRASRQALHSAALALALALASSTALALSSSWIHRPLTRVATLQPNPYMWLLVLSRVHFTTHSMKL